MSEENVDLLRELQEGWNRGDPVIPAEIFHPDVEFLQPLWTKSDYSGPGAESKPAQNDPCSVRTSSRPPRSAVEPRTPGARRRPDAVGPHHLVVLVLEDVAVPDE